MTTASFAHEASTASAASSTSDTLLPTTGAGAESSRRIRLAQGETTVDFKIDAPKLSRALIQLTEQSGLQLIYPAGDKITDLPAAPVTGKYTTEAALKQLLKGTGLEYEFIDARTISIVDPNATSANEERSDRSPKDSLQHVIVTGSRIRRAEVESNNPLSVVGKQQLETFSTTNVIDIINRQPQLSLGGDLQVSTIAAGFKNSGVSTANLRGLGDNRTLTLINGRRQVAGSSGTSAVDLNTISTTSLERVEIVTGGSSAVYGADAIAGVINLITRQDFEGILGEAQAGFTEDGGGSTRHFAATAGKNFANDRANIMFSLSHDEERPIYSAQRDYFTAPGGLRGGYSYVPNPLRTAANVTVPRFIPMFGVTGITYRQYGHPVITTPIGNNAAYSLSFDDAGNLTPYNVGTRLVDGAGRLQNNSVNCPDCYYGSELGTIRNSLERTGGELQARYELLQNGDGAISNVEAFLEAKYYAVDSKALFGFSTYGGAGPSSVKAGGYAISIDNPYAPAALVDLMAANGLTHVDVTRINNDFGQDIDGLRNAFAAGDRVLSPGRLLDLSSEFRMQRYVTGLRGTFSNDWKFEVYGNYGRTRADFTNADYLDSVFRRQIDAVIDPGSGNVVCRSTLTDPNDGCIPINIMQPGSASTEALNYSFRRPVQKDTITQTNAVATLDGSLFSWSSPWSGAELPVAFAAGVEYRREASESIPDEYGLSGDLFHLGQKVATIGRYSSVEAFGELNVPLLRDVPFAKSLSLSGSYRYQDYTTTGSDGSYGLSASWAPSSDVKFRGSFARAVRAPNVNELFSGTNISNQGVADPCDVSRVDTGPAPGNRRANCQAAIGAGAANFVQTPSGKFVILQGNPNLDAETADTVTVGIVLTPSLVPDLVLTADYYRNEIEGVITSLAANQIVENCVDSPTLDNEFCDAVTRDVSGNVDTVIAQVFNLARYRTHGWDFGAAYRTAAPGERGHLTFQANATHLLELVYDPVPTNPALKTRLDKIAPNPTWRANFNVRYEIGAVNADWNVRYLGDVIRNWRDVVGDYSMTEAHPESGSYVQHDLRLAYLFGNHQLYVGVDNVLDEAAPMTPFTYTQAMYPRIGRNFYAGVKASF